MKQHNWYYIPILILAFQLAALATPVAAQSGASCQIDLVQTVTALSQAQRQADGGDLLQALLTIEDVQAELDAILKKCKEVGIPLEETFTSADALFRFSYPEHWAISNPEPNIYFAANSQEALEVGSDNPENMTSGSQLIAFFIGPMNELSDDVSDFDSFVEAFKEEGLNEDISLIGPVSSAPVNGYEARAFNISGPKVAGFLHMLNLNDGLVLIAVGVTPYGEADKLEATYRSVLKSMRYGVSASLLPPGKSLEEISYVEATPIDDLIKEVDPQSAVLAPDGSAVAWFDQRQTNAICLYTFETTQTTCIELSDPFRGQPSLLLWSPDSNYIAFTEEFFRHLHEPDIWLLDIAGQQVMNHTNDGVEQSLLSPNRNTGGPTWLDHTFTWGPEGNLYFIRQEIFDGSDPDNAAIGLYRLNPEGGNVEFIQDLTPDFERFSIYNTPEYHLSGAMAVSPDGQTLAFLVRAQDSQSGQNGLWTLELSGQARPNHLVTPQAMTQGVPLYALEETSSVIPFGLAWSDDSKQLYLLAGPPPALTVSPQVISVVDSETGALTPLTDLSHLESGDILEVDETTGHQGAYYIPRTAVMSPDRTTPLTLHLEDAGGQAGLKATLLNQASGEPIILYEKEEYRPIPNLISSAATDGKLLMRGYLFIPSE